jgi:hypothetical protein
MGPPRGGTVLRPSSPLVCLHLLATRVERKQGAGHRPSTGTRNQECLLCVGGPGHDHVAHRRVRGPHGRLRVVRPVPDHAGCSFGGRPRRLGGPRGRIDGEVLGVVPFVRIRRGAIARRGAFRYLSEPRPGPRTRSRTTRAWSGTRRRAVVEVVTTLGDHWLGFRFDFDDRDDIAKGFIPARTRQVGEAAVGTMGWGSSATTVPRRPHPTVRSRSLAASDGPLHLLGGTDHRPDPGLRPPAVTQGGTSTGDHRPKRARDG